MHILSGRGLESLPHFIGEATQTHRDELIYPRHWCPCMTEQDPNPGLRDFRGVTQVNVKEADRGSFLHPLNKYIFSAYDMPRMCPALLGTEQ